MLVHLSRTPPLKLHVTPKDLEVGESSPVVQPSAHRLMSTNLPLKITAASAPSKLAAASRSHRGTHECEIEPGDRKQNKHAEYNENLAKTGISLTGRPGLAKLDDIVVHHAALPRLPGEVQVDRKSATSPKSCLKIRRHLLRTSCTIRTSTREGSPAPVAICLGTPPLTGSTLAARWPTRFTVDARAQPSLFGEGFPLLPM